MSYGLDALGDANSRWATIAIVKALEDVGGRHVRLLPRDVLLVDEPERALHPTAVVQVASALRKSSNYTLVATHSPIVLDMADNSIHLQRTPDTRLVSLADLTSGLGDGAKVAAEALGMRVGDLLATVRIFVLVEGEHDRAVLGPLLKGELESARAVLFPWNGHRLLKRFAETRFLVDMTDARFLVVLDNIRHSIVAKAVASVKRSESLAKVQRTLSPEDDTLVTLAAMMHRLGTQEIGRLEVSGIGCSDVIKLLPVEEVVPTPRWASWEAFDRGFLEAQGRGSFRSGDGSLWKEWMRAEHGAKITAAELGRASERFRRTCEARLAEGAHERDVWPPDVIRLRRMLRSVANGGL